MTTKVTMLSEGHNKKLQDEIYYKENSKQVLTKLIEKGYHIEKYNKIQSEYSSLLNTANVEFVPENTGIIAKKSIDEIVLNKGEIRVYNPKPEKIIEDFIKNYLIKVVEIKQGSQTMGPGQRVLHSNSSVVENVSYLTLRKKKKDENREIYLQNILDYGEALFGEKFNMKELEKRINAIKKEMPTKVEPTKTYFATLRANHKV